jgi:hypothetical protein
MRNYYNTTGISGKELQKAILNCKTQEETILEVFRTTKEKLTPFEVSRILIDKAWPITSIRRAMTNLTSNGKLLQTAEKVEEIYGAKNYKWQIA